MTEEGTGGGNSTRTAAIIAMMLLVGLSAWFFLGQASRKPGVSAPADSASIRP